MFKLHESSSDCQFETQIKIIIIPCFVLAILLTLVGVFSDKVCFCLPTINNYHININNQQSTKSLFDKKSEPCCVASIRIPEPIGVFIIFFGIAFENLNGSSLYTINSNMMIHWSSNISEKRIVNRHYFRKVATCSPCIIDTGFLISIFSWIPTTGATSLLPSSIQ